MKYFIIFLFLISTINFLQAGQQICLPESETDKALSIKSRAGDKVCSDIPSEQCICRPQGYSWHELKKIGSLGNRYLVFDSIKKDAYVITKSILNAKNALRKVGKDKRDNCTKALNYISGIYDANTEAQSDVIETDFADIQDALLKCRYKKAKRLIGLVDDPDYNPVRDELLILLN